MKKIAKFEKVSFKEFKKGYLKNIDPNEIDEGVIKELYEAIKLPKRATKGSAGYDFFTPCRLILKPGRMAIVPTGIRVRIDEGWVLKLYPRSGLGFKYGMQLRNTVGIIDSDYYYSDNEGHIFAKIKNCSKQDFDLIKLGAGDAFMQGVFVEYGITYDDDTTEIRNGGFGSTSK